MATDVSFAWDPNPVGNDVTAGYRIWVGTKTGQYDYSINVGTDTTGVAPGLSDDTKYYFAVTAYDNYGNESDYSTEVFWHGNLWAGPPGLIPPNNFYGSPSIPSVSVHLADYDLLVSTNAWATSNRIPVSVDYALPFSITDTNVQFRTVHQEKKITITINR
jgi:hypothetical protein